MPLGAPTIVEAENDFPITLNFVRVGSAHQVATDASQEQANIELLATLIRHVMERFEPDKEPSAIVVEQLWPRYSSRNFETLWVGITLIGQLGKLRSHRRQIRYVGERVERKIEVYFALRGFFRGSISDRAILDRR